MIFYKLTSQCWMPVANFLKPEQLLKKLPYESYKEVPDIKVCTCPSTF